MFEEIKEMIDSTVYPNGNGEVTAQNINLAMQGIVDATEEKIAEVEEMVAEIGENGVGGSGALRVWTTAEGLSTELTPEQIAENVATYNEIVKGEPVSVVLCQGGSVDGMTIVATMPTTVSCMDLGGNKTVSLLAHQLASRDITIIMAYLDSDGSVAILTETFDVPTSSGGLYFIRTGQTGDFSDLTADDFAYNAAIHHKVTTNTLDGVIAITAMGMTMFAVRCVTDTENNTAIVSFANPTMSGGNYYYMVSFVISADGSLIISQ